VIESGARLGSGIDGLVRWWRLAIRALCDKNRVWRRAESVNCDWIVCRIGVGLEKSPGLRSRTRSSQKGSLRTPGYTAGGSPYQAKGTGLHENSAPALSAIIPVMIAKMKPIAPSQSKSPASVPRLAEMSGSILLFMIGLLVNLGRC